MDNNGFGFIIMVKGCKEFISEQVRKQKGIFENDWGNQIAEFGVYGKTVHTFVYTADTKKRYVHIYYSAAKAAGERARLEESIQEMQSYLKRFQDTEHEFGPSFHKYSICITIKIQAILFTERPKLQVIQDELDLCGYLQLSHLKKWMRKKQSPYIRIEMRRKKYFVQINLTWVITVCELLLRKLHQIKYLLDLLP